MSNDYYQRMWKEIHAGSSFEAVVPNRRKDGEIWYYDQTIHPLKDEAGTISSFVSTGKDITEQIRFEKALQSSEERFRSLFENSPIALWEDDFSAIKLNFDELRSAGVNDLRVYLDENPKQLEKLIKKVKIIDVNQSALEMSGAETREELIENFTKLTTDLNLDVWKEQFISLSEGLPHFRSESSFKSF